MKLQSTCTLKSTSIIPYKSNSFDTNKTCNNLNQSTHGEFTFEFELAKKVIDINLNKYSTDLILLTCYQEPKKNRKDIFETILMLFIPM